MSDGAESGVYSPGHWQAVHDALVAIPEQQRTAADHGQLAAALFWLNEPRASIEAHRRAFQQWQIESQPAEAVRSTWFLFYEHWLVGETVVARGWLERGRRLVADVPGLADSEVDGWLAVAQTDICLTEGRLDRAVGEATRGRRIGERENEVDLVAMALQAEGRTLIASGDVEGGLARLDDAMVSVIGNELQPLFTGWVYCNVIAACHSVGDLRRANEWSTAALRWCESLREGLLYPGLCRVYNAQLSQLRGDWSEAERAAREACENLAEYDQRYAGAAHYLVGELCRLQGRRAEAVAAFERARELGHDGQPGMSLLQAAAGRIDDALAALRAAAGNRDTSAGAATLPPLQLLTALIDVAEEAGDRQALLAACEGVQRLGRSNASLVAQAYARSAEGRAAAATGRNDDAFRQLSRARELFDEVDVPYESARQRQHLARLAAARGDDPTARLELEAAAAVFERLGANDDLNATATMSGYDAVSAVGRGAHRGPTPGSATADIAILSSREREVLALVSVGLTNKSIAERLHISPHTVARHLANIFAKLGVGSRTAASTIAVAAGLRPPTTGD